MSESVAGRRQALVDRNRFFHDQDARYLRFLVPEGRRVLELGCGNGHLLAGLRPGHGVGADFSAAMIDEARSRHPDLTFLQGDIEDPAFLAELAGHGPFDVILLVDILVCLDDIQATLESLSTLCHPDTRLIIAHHAPLWQPALRLAERLGWKTDYGDLNELTPDDIVNLLDLAGLQAIRQERRQLVPLSLAGIGAFVNRWVAPLPLLRRLCLRNYVIARAPAAAAETAPTCSVVIPCRNERGNIEPAVLRTPQMGPDMELVFVEGHSQDGTWEEIQRVRAAYPDRRIVCLQQPGKGKGDAVRAAFAVAGNDILMILDADLTTPPEDMPKFYRAIADGKGEFINGTRLVYPMESEAMRFLNYWANRTFALIFSYLLNQRFTDTLCGTKVLRRSAYREIERNRGYFGEFDPFGDFDLIFGASRLNLRIVEVPVRYAARTYGSTQISRFSHGWLLLRMVVFAFRKLKAL